MTSNSSQEESPMVVSTQPDTLGSENDSQVTLDENHSQLPEAVSERPNYMMRPKIDLMVAVLGDVADERVRQHHKWGEQNHPNRTGPKTTPLNEIVRGPGSREGDLHFARGLALMAQMTTDRHAKAGTLTWLDIFLEEVFEAVAECDPVALRAELVQVAAVATAWVEVHRPPERVMSIKSKLYYWLECDRDGCDAKAPDGDEYSAFEDHGQAIDCAEGWDWVITAAGEHYCDRCATQEDKDSADLVSDVRGDTLPGLTP